jgi:hypothetical protein
MPKSRKRKLNSGQGGRKHHMKSHQFHNKFSEAKEWMEQSPERRADIINHMTGKLK